MSAMHSTAAGTDAPSRFEWRSAVVPSDRGPIAGTARTVKRICDNNECQPSPREVTRRFRAELCGRNAVGPQEATTAATPAGSGKNMPVDGSRCQEWHAAHTDATMTAGSSPCLLPSAVGLVVR